MKIPDYSNLSVYFFIADHVKYFDDSLIYVAEGLKELGVKFYSNKNFWKESPNSDQYLFNHDANINFQECDLVILSYTWFEYIDHLTFKPISEAPPANLFDPNRSYKTVYVDATDGYRTKSWETYFRNFDLILRAKYNKRTYNPSNVKPWVHGFTNRIVKATEPGRCNINRRNVILENFNYTHNYLHGVRSIAQMKVLPKIETHLPIDRTKTTLLPENLDEYDALMWTETGGKHHPKYYELVNTALANACFCGELIPACPFNPEIFMGGGGKKKVFQFLYRLLSEFSGKSPRLIQWDSWRFWETLASGSLAVHLDLEEYGVGLPVMPQNWQHYIGFNLNTIDVDIERFKQVNLSLIAQAGRDWAFENYSPKESAKRLLAAIGLKR